MKHKVKIFQSIYEDRLETKVNDWLESNQDVAIVDIKYVSSQCGSSGGSIYYSYSALIHYMED
jgi:hypothetical protein